MLRRNKKKDQTGQQFGSAADYSDRNARPNYLRSSSDLLRDQQTSSSSTNVGDIPSSPATPVSGHFPQSNSAEAMPPPQHHHHTGGINPSTSFSSSSGAGAGTGKSHSALNFLFSKAKNSLTPGNSNSNNADNNASSMSTAASTGSLASIPDQQQQHPHRHWNPYGSHDVASVARSSSSDFRQQQQQQPPRGFGRPSVDVDVTSMSSPTKKGFFSRDRKGSATGKQIGSYSSQARQPYAHGSTHSGGGHASNAGSVGSAAGVSYGQYSKSQSDLHSGAEFPSPLSTSVDLPPVPALPGSIPTTGIQQSHKYYLRSPSPADNAHSRSVEDLNAGLSSQQHQQHQHHHQKRYRNQQQQQQYEPSSPHGLGLRSPSPQPIMYSSSPSGQTGQAAGGRISPSPMSNPSTGATWGEHGVPAQSWGRPSDLASMRYAESRSSNSNTAPHNNHLPSPQPSKSPSMTMGGQSSTGAGPSRPENIPFSAQSQGSSWVPRGSSPTPEQPIGGYATSGGSGGSSGHSRKNSKLAVSPDHHFFSSGGSSPGRSSHEGGRRNVAAGLASSFSLGQVAAGASNVMDKLRGPSSNTGNPPAPASMASPSGIGSGSVYAAERQSSMDSLVSASGQQQQQSTPPILPPGATHVGFINRSGNVSLAFNQLGGPQNRSEKEKDISKGWKPYKVVLHHKDGQLLFYKPPGGVNEDVKNVFPTGLVRQQPQQQASSSRYPAGQVLDAEALKQSGFKTQDLLLATSSTSGALTRSPPASPTKRSASALAVDSTSTSLTGMAQLASPSSPSSAALSSGVCWERQGKHARLELVVAPRRPKTWSGRIFAGSLEALAHEVIFASQLVAEDHADNTPQMVQAVLLTCLMAGHDIETILATLNDQATHAMAMQATSGSANGERSTESPAENLAEAGQSHFASEDELKAFRSDLKSRGKCIIELVLSHHADALDAKAASVLDQLGSTVGVLDADIDAKIKDVQAGEATRPTATDWSQEKPDAPRPKLASLTEGRLSAADLLSFEPADVAEQIQVFHVNRFRALASPQLWASDLTGAQRHANLFAFNGTSPHYLTTMILDQVLDGDEAPSSAQQISAAAKHRASLLRHWIAIASYLLSFGDIAGWVAVLSAICSRAIARLEQTWRFVAEGDRTLIASSWAPRLARMKWNEEGKIPIEAALTMASITSRRPKISPDGNGKLVALPYLGDSLPRANQAFAALASPVANPEQLGPSSLPVSTLAADASNLYQILSRWHSEVCSGASLDSASIVAVSKPIVELQQMLQVRAIQNSTTPCKSIASYLDVSLRLEPRNLGNVDLRWRPPMAPNVAAKALLPLIFPEALPNLDLIDKEQIVAAANATSNGQSGTNRDGNMSTSSSKFDLEATIRANRYIRSPLSGTPLMRASIQSLARSKTYPGGKGSRAVPFSNITAWGSPSLRGDETLFHIGSDLVLQVVGEPPPSVPNSPMANSKRFSQELSRGSRPLSQISKRSSLPASNRSSFVEHSLPIHVTVKTATLERLVDILVLGVSDLTIGLGSDDNSELPLQSSRRPRASMDLTGYRTTFLATYRSICAPLVLLDFLRKRYMAAINAAREFSNMPTGPNVSRFPSWSLIDTSASGNLEPVDWEFVGRVRHGVVAVLRLWVYHFAQDFADDADLYASLVSFEEQIQGSADLLKPDGISDAELGDSTIASGKITTAIQEVVVALRERCMKVNTRRWTAPGGKHDSVINKSTESNSNTVTTSTNKTWTNNFDFDAATPAELVEYMECIAMVFFDKVTERDLLIVAELFEKQAQDPLGWQAPRDTSSSSEPQVIAMYKLLEYLWPPGQYQKPGAESVYQRLPATVRDACAAQSLLRGWIAVHIIEPKIGVQRRQARLEKLLDATWICRARMLNARTEEVTSTPLAASAPFQESTIGSYIESVIIGSLTASESRTFTRAWQGVCHARGGTGDGLSDLLPSKDDLISLNMAATSATSTPDIGWLLRCIAQAVTRKGETDSSTMIDFERSSIVHNLIESSLAIKQSHIDPTTAELAGVRLNAMQAKLRSVLWDRRLFKDDAAQEAQSVPPLPSKTTYRAYRPLQRLVHDQSEKQSRDRVAYDALQYAAQEAAHRANANATRAMSPSSISSSTSPLLGPQSFIGRSSSSLGGGGLFGGGGSSSSSGPGASSAEKRSRRVTALFRGAVRQTGLMGGSSGSSSSNLDKIDRGGEGNIARSYNDLLNAVPTGQKPALAVGLAGAQVSVWNNAQRSWIFHLTSQEGNHLLLQASSQSALAEWLSHLDKTISDLPAPLSKTSVSQDASKKSFQMSRSAGTRSAATTFLPLYETEISALVEKEGRAIPLGLERMLTEIESRGLREQGIYRISGAKSSIENMKQSYCIQPAEQINLSQGEFSDVHTIAGAVKLWYRDLPNPAIPFASYHRMIEAVGIENHDDRLYAIRDAIWDFPKIHFDLLRRTSEHLTRVAEEGEVNLMLPHNLGLVFGTSLLRPPPGPTAMSESFANLGKAAHIVKLILTYHDWLFEPEPEPEAEANAEGEVEEDQQKTADGHTSGHGGGGDVSTVVEEDEDRTDDDDGQEVADANLNSEDSIVDAATGTDRLLAQVQRDQEQSSSSNDQKQHSRAASSGDPITSQPGSAAMTRSATSLSGSGPDVYLTDTEGDIIPQSDVSPSTVASASSKGQAIARPSNTLSTPRRGAKEESVYADALEVALDSPATNLLFANRSSLLPDEAMMDIIRLMGANGEAELDLIDSE
ncbi:unnamed protein product [Sympodiomycopsis kandeliae]